MSGSVEVEAIATVNKWSKKQKEEEAEEGKEGHRRDAEGLIPCDVRDKLLEEPRFANYLSKDSDFQGTRKREKQNECERERAVASTSAQDETINQCDVCAFFVLGHLAWSGSAWGFLFPTVAWFARQTEIEFCVVRDTYKGYSSEF